MPKPYTIRYYQIQVSGDETQQSALRLSRALTQLSRKVDFINYSQGGYDYVLAGRSLSVDRGGFYFGTFVKNQTQNIAKFNSITGHINPPEEDEFQDGDGVGKEKCFMIDPAANILCVESRQGSASVGSLLRWIELNIRNMDQESLDVTLTYGVVIKPNALSKFNAMNHMFNVVVKLAHVSNANYLDDGGRRAFNDLVGNADDSAADKIMMKLSTFSDRRGSNRDSLNAGWVRRTIRGLLRRQRGEQEALPILTSVYVEGVNEQGDIERFDLIKDELKDQIRVDENSVRIVTNFNAAQHITAIAENYRPIREEVLAAYRINEDN